MNRKLLTLLLLTFFIICEFYVGHVGAQPKTRSKNKGKETSTSDTRFANKVILITGASSGIGAHAALHLAKKGACVSLIGRDKKRLNDVCEQIQSAGAPIPLIIVADVTKDAQRIIDETVKHFGKLDILINNAGLATANNAENVDMADYDYTMNLNVRSIVELIKYAIPHLEKTKGNILNISSIAGFRNRPNSYVYSMSKAAVNQLTKCAARDMGPKGIRVNALCPGAIRTAIFERNWGWTSQQVEQMFDELSSLYPVGRVGDVTDTSAAIEYLVSDSAAFVTGTLLTLDGGALVAGQ